MARSKLPVVVIIVCAVKCLAMTSEELEDFAEYLEKTSQLYPTLKKGGDSDVEYDDSDTIPENAWEESGKFEGDMVLNERQRRLIVENVVEGLSRNGVVDGSKRWPNNEVIVYIQVEHFTSDQIQGIRNGIEDLERVSCIKFRPYRKGDRDAVVIQGNRRGCFSQVGYQGGYQVLNLSSRHPAGRGCFRHGTVVHELLHALGFYHMQSSPDRDDYVNIVWSNIAPQARNNFRKYNSFSVSDFGVGYDYDSVLHYSRQAFSINGMPTIVPKQSGVEIGQRIGLSDKDVQKLNKMYCDADLDRDEADENPSKLTPHTINKSKKKKAKNKPFEGQGIGYHQGKAVAIKLLPAAETYKLRDVPSFHVFDYFSKEPQILSTMENEAFRIGKEIAYSYNPPEPLTIPENNTPIDFATMLELEQVHNENNGKIAEGKHENVNSQHGERPIFSNSGVNLSSDDGYIRSADNEKVDPDLNDAFDRLSKIIKVHVYPSQTPDFNVYKIMNHSPIMKNEREELVADAPIHPYTTEAGDMKTAIGFINNLYHVSSDKSLSENNDKKEDNRERLTLKQKTVTSVVDNYNKKQYPSMSFPTDQEYISTPGFGQHEQQRKYKYYEPTKEEAISEHGNNKNHFSFSYPQHYEKYRFISGFESPKDGHSQQLQKDKKTQENDEKWYQKYIPPEHINYNHYSTDTSEEPQYENYRNENSYISSFARRI